MIDNSYEKEQIKKHWTFIYITLTLLFSYIFMCTSLFILYFPMTGILDFPYYSSKLAIFSFVMSIVFSALGFKNLFGKILFVLNVFLFVFMIVYGP